MYFHFLSEYLLPSEIKDNIRKTIELFNNSDDLKTGIQDAFANLPFNFVDRKTLKDKLAEIEERFIKASEKTTIKEESESGKDKERFLVWKDPSYGRYHSLLKESFREYPLSMLAKKGVASGAKEALVLSDGFPLPLFFFHTVYPLCWQVLEEKNKFSINKHPLYPLFHRYMQEPLAVAMSLSMVETAFKGESRASDIVSHYIQYLSQNYRAGTVLYKCGLHLRWKDWRDESQRCYGKIETIMEWIDLLSDMSNNPEQEQIISMWAVLFDISAMEVQGMLAATKVAPVISENENLEKLLLGFFDYVVKNPKEFRTEQIKDSNNPIAEVVRLLITKRVSFNDILGRIPALSSESIIRDFVGKDLPGWSFALDLHSGCFRIYAPPMAAVMLGGNNKKEE